MKINIAGAGPHDGMEFHGPDRTAVLIVVTINPEGLMAASVCNIRRHTVDKLQLAELLTEMAVQLTVQARSGDD